MHQLTITYKPYTITLKTPFSTSKGDISERNGILITIKDAAEIKGTGDCAPLPEFGSESFNQALKAIQEFNSGFYIDDKDINKTIYFSLRQFDSLPSLKHGLEQALVNYFCSKNKLSLNEAFRYSSSKSVNINAAVGILSPEETEEKAKSLIAQGYNTIKIKAGRADFDEEFDCIRAVRNLSKTLNIRIDVNGKWKYAQAAEYLSELRIFKPEYVEQPVSSREEFAELKTKTKIPLAADESLRSIEDAAYFIGSKAADVLILKPMLLGGIQPVIHIFEEAAKHKIKCIVSSSFESVVGRSYALFAASIVKNNAAHGLGTAEYILNDLFPDPYPVENGIIKLH